MLTLLRTSLLLACLLLQPAAARAAEAAPEGAPTPAPAAASGDQGADWRSEFEAVCSQTDLALTLSNEELAQLIARCDRLAERLGAEPEVVRRIYLKRLGKCRDLLLYVLESRKAAPSGATEPSVPAPPPAPPAPPAGPAPAAPAGDPR